MNIWANAVLTQKGLALQSKLIEGHSLEITKIEIGAASVTPGLLMQATRVEDVKKTLTKVTSVSYPEDGKCAVKIHITNDDVTTGYTAKQIGFYADDPDEGEILYFIAQAETGQGTIIPAVGEMASFSAEWTFYFQYGQADGVHVSVDPAGTVSAAEMQRYVVETITTTVLDTKGQPDGLASLDAQGKIPDDQLPDDFDRLAEKYGMTLSGAGTSLPMTLVATVNAASPTPATRTTVIAEDGETLKYTETTVIDSTMTTRTLDSTGMEVDGQ
ncbi:MAG: hypothetical protein Q4C56_04115 [Peptococcaceae bacterium]|nr:hypothetical protein [Peptococcaceae bacterium]